MLAGKPQRLPLHVVDMAVLGAVVLRLLAHERPPISFSGGSFLKACVGRKCGRNHVRQEPVRQGPCWPASRVDCSQRGLVTGVEPAAPTIRSARSIVPKTGA